MPAYMHDNKHTNTHAWVQSSTHGWPTTQLRIRVAAMSIGIYISFCIHSSRGVTVASTVLFYSSLHMMAASYSFGAAKAKRQRVAPELKAGDIQVVIEDFLTAQGTRDLATLLEPLRASVTWKSSPTSSIAALSKLSDLYQALFRRCRNGLLPRKYLTSALINLHSKAPIWFAHGRPADFADEYSQVLKQTSDRMVRTYTCNDTCDHELSPSRVTQASNHSEIHCNLIEVVGCVLRGAGRYDADQCDVRSKSSCSVYFRAIVHRAPRPITPPDVTAIMFRSDHGCHGLSMVGIGKERHDCESLRIRKCSRLLARRFNHMKYLGKDGHLITLCSVTAPPFLTRVGGRTDHDTVWVEDIVEITGNTP